MKKKLTFILILSFVLFCMILQTLSGVINNEQNKIDAQEISIIQENVKDRFKIYMQMPLSLAIIGADYFSEGSLTEKSYGNFFDKVLLINKEILGFNLLDENGRIVKVYPEKTNNRAFGKFSQNIQALKKSFENGEQFWLSPPFKLYQGEVGFAFYVPITKEKKLVGWFTAVITTRGFIQNFSLKEFLKTYELNIKDVSSETPYFATAITPATGLKIYESMGEIFGRKVVFQSWRKTLRAEFSLPLHWMILFSLIMALVTTQIFKVIEQRRRSQEQLSDIGILLKLTSNEALSNLVDAESEAQNTSSEQSGYLNNLLEQINLLQTMTKDSNDLYQDSFSLSETFKEQIRFFYEIVAKKKILLDLNFGPENDFITANKWLIEHSVIHNVLSHAIVLAKLESKVLISSSINRGILTIKIEVPKIQEKRLAINWDRRMEVAKKTLNIYLGNLSIENNESLGMTLHLTMKVGQ